MLGWACLIRPRFLGSNYIRHITSLCVVFCIHVQAHFFWFEKAEATADFQLHYSHRPPSSYQFFQLRAHWVQISWSIELAISTGHVPSMGVRAENILLRCPTPCPIGKQSGPGCSKLLRSLVNVSFKFQTLIHNIH